MYSTIGSDAMTIRPRHPFDINVLFLIHFGYAPGFGTDQHDHVDCSTSTLLLMHFAPNECGSSGSLQQFIRRHSPRSSFFSAFEDLLLCITGIMESHGVRKLYAPSPIPTLYVGKVEDILCPVPLFPCFLDGNIKEAWIHNFHHSIQICSLTESGLCIRLCRWTSTWIAQRQPCL
jgi:hypothetical protein